MLRRRSRERYVLVRYTGTDAAAMDSLSNRCTELFGRLALEKAALRLIKSQQEHGIMILRLNLTEIHPILVSMALTDPPLVAMGMSGGIRRLRNRLRSYDQESSSTLAAASAPYQDLSEFRPEEWRG